jgi:dTDP-4-dehydrorhamnose reductase
MKVLVTGALGQLGHELRRLSGYLDFTFIFTDINELDVTSKAGMDLHFQSNKADIVINCAAFTAVDSAEKESILARRVNSDSCLYLAELSRKYGFRILHISDNFVFDGKKYTPYRENDRTAPLSVYGKTRLEGERHIISKARSYIIIRTSWLYSSFGNNFVKTIIKSAGKKMELKVISDEFGTPTYAGDLASAIFSILPRFSSGTRQIYHYTNEGTASWYDFAMAVCELREIKTPVIPVSSAEYASPAKRPPYSVLSKEKIKKDFKLTIPYWRESLKTCLELIK